MVSKGFHIKLYMIAPANELKDQRNSRSTICSLLLRLILDLLPSAFDEKLASKDKTLKVRRDAFHLLNLLLQVVEGVAILHGMESGVAVCFDFDPNVNVLLIGNNMSVIVVLINRQSIVVLINRQSMILCFLYG